MAIFLHHDDLPEGVDFGPSVAIDTETMGLNPLRDRLCLVQLSSGDGDAHLVKIGLPAKTATRLATLLANASVTKLFHFARFDLASLMHCIGPVLGPVYCTKIAS
ncbi:MAG: ribonuclease D, partial [Pseudomonadota bacterium]|nr:ribonuclease D [Pseudomonadota bacterium]